MKICSKCQIERPLDMFSRQSSKTGKLRARCKSCDKIYDAKRYSENREKELARAKQYYRLNLEERKEYSRKYYLSNSISIKEKAKRNYPKYKESRMDNNRLRRAAKSGNDFSPYSITDVILRYGHICYLCNDKIDMNAPRKPGLAGWELGLHLDHVIDISAGGSDSLDNVRPTHGICNLKKPRVRRKK